MGYVVRIGVVTDCDHPDWIKFEAATEQEALDLVRLGLRNGHEVLIFKE
ncbi:MAG: hypothetical protein ACYC5Y_05090 [Symbiobacteriia bacterium]